LRSLKVAQMDRTEIRETFDEMQEAIEHLLATTTMLQKENRKLLRELSSRALHHTELVTGRLQQLRYSRITNFGYPGEILVGRDHAAASGSRLSVADTEVHRASINV
jgi:hypothetical protein